MFTPFVDGEAVAALLVAAAVCAVLVIKTRSTWSRLMRVGDLGAVQAAHSTPTPRLGGIAVFVAVVAAALLALPGWESLWVLLLTAAVPLFLSGAAEDLGFPVAPAGRLAAALASSSLVVWFSGTWISHTGVPVLDLLLAWSPLAIVISVVAAAAVAHAFNLIDGLNGLAGSAALIGALSLLGTALSVNDMEVAVIASVLAAAVLGFLLFNFPFGTIFFGDAGAYTVGFLLAWMGILLAGRHADVTPFAMLLALFWPLADLTLAIVRRYQRKSPLSAPDRLHFHHLVLRSLEIAAFGRSRRSIANPVATAVMLPLIAAPALAGFLLHDRPAEAMAALAIFFVLYFALYLAGMRFAVNGLRNAPVVGQRDGSKGLPAAE